VEVDGTSALGNQLTGIAVWGTGNTIGGVAPGAGNIVAFNGSDGVSIGSGHANNPIRGNSIFSNVNVTLLGFLPIDLNYDGSTPNDAGDGDSGGNNLQNYPVLSTAFTNASGTTFTGTLSSEPNKTYTLDFYISSLAAACGDIQSYRGSSAATTDGSGNAAFNVLLAGGSPYGFPATAAVIATDPLGNTSESGGCAVMPTSPGDSDCDGVLDAAPDNCISVHNPQQVNTDNEIDNGPGIATRDVTVPRGVSDAEGDACETDGDIDNDILFDPFEDPLGTCFPFNGIAAGHPNPRGGDITNDDNGNGNPALPMGTDMADNGPSWDTDNDGVYDRLECLVGFNPRSALSRPSVALCGGSVDADGDGLPVSGEVCKWGTSDTPVSGVDSDGDGKADCVEANDTNGDGFQNFTGDTINSAKAANGIIGRTMDFDLNGDNAVNFPGDTLLSAKMASHVGGICP
jgi:hypothetical protein